MLGQVRGYPPDHGQSRHLRDVRVHLGERNKKDQRDVRADRHE